MDIGNIILWKSNKELISIIENTFNNRILLKKEVSSDTINRREIIDNLYYPIVPEPNDVRYYQTDTITVFLIKLNPSSKFMWRTEGYRLCNNELLQFKLSNRNNYSHLEFHCSDNITEANKAIDVFNIDFNTNLEIIDVDNLYHFIHGDASNKNDCYLTKDFKIVPISHSPAVNYLKGYKNEYFSQSKLFIPREDSIKYHFENYNSENIDYIIKVVKLGNNYVVCDGMHRSSVLYFYGNQKILVEIVDSISDPASEFYAYITPNDVPMKIENSHWNSLYKLVHELNNEQIKWIAVRGFRKMPYTADTDLDIVIHPNDYDKFCKIMDRFIELGYFRTNHKNLKYNHNSKELYYSAYSTNGNDGNYISNNCFQLDIYNNLFFFDNNNGVCLNNGFIDEMFKYIKINNHIVIPHMHFELVILLFRIQVDKNGYWSDKHKYIFDSISKNPKFISSDFKKLLSYATSNSDITLKIDINNLV